MTEQPLVTRTGIRLVVRTARPDDASALAAFFREVSPEDLRFRFLTAVRTVGAAQIAAMVAPDHDRSEAYLARDADSEEVVGAAMLATSDDGSRGEVAISVRADLKNRGIGWTLLDHVATRAKAKGVQTLESIESRDNRGAIELEREMGFTSEPVPGDSTLVLLRRHLA